MCYPGCSPSFFNLLNPFHSPPQQSASATALTTDRQQVTSKRRLFLCFLSFGLAPWCQSRVPVPAREIGSSQRPASAFSVAKNRWAFADKKCQPWGAWKQERFRDLGSLSFWRGVVGHGLCVTTPPPPQIHRGEPGEPGLVCLCLVCLEGNKAVLERPSLRSLFCSPAIGPPERKNVTVQSILHSNSTAEIEIPSTMARLRCPPYSLDSSHAPCSRPSITRGRRAMNRG